MMCRMVAGSAWAICCALWSGLAGWRTGAGEREHLKDVPIKHDEVLVDQGISCHEVVLAGALEQRTNLIEAVVGQAVSVSHENQKDIQLASGKATLRKPSAGPCAKLYP